METPTQFTQDTNKVIEAVIYMAEQSKDDSYFGERKVYKLLYYADCEAYRQHGAPITGTMYVHYPHGPFPENWPTLKKRMITAGDVQIFGSHPREGRKDHGLNLIYPQRSVREGILTPEDYAILSAQVKRFAGFNFAGIEEYVQEEAGWFTTDDGDTIPYEASGISAPPLSADGVRRGKSIAERRARQRTPLRSPGDRPV
ncbi:MAG: Panacea domain-containing protein [Chloroflexota bacterium]|nr:Panacea domain-containing protein [Chloroflexota bacterium]MDE2960844.1 Panacea domain-containing protein [Chloroflexota bacterium]